RRRPDIRQAEALLHASTADVGVAVASLFPDISLTGQFGFRNTRASDLARWSSHFYSVGPAITLPIFEGGKLVAEVRIAKAQQASAALAYRQTVLAALQDVDDALARYRTDQFAREELARAVEANRTSFALAGERYRAGLASFLDVLDAQRALAVNEDRLA